jgi:HSP20 family molecular chaperone IbpA
MASSTIIPVVYTQKPPEKYHLGSSTSSSNRYSVQDHGQGYRTYSYEFDLYDYEPQEITVLLDDNGTLRIRAHRSPCREFRREYNLGGPNVETTLVRNTIDTHGRLRVDIDVRPRRYDLQPINTNNILTFDLQGYNPENVNVRINRNGLLKISGQHLDNTFGNHINREYFRQYQLPSNIDPDQVRARMDENQILTIELPQSSSKNYTKREYWVPVYERSYPPFYGAGPSGGYCCCNLM